MKYFLALLVALNLSGCSIPPMPREEAAEICAARADKHNDQHWEDWFENCMRALGHGEPEPRYW